jgi:hypothetical protein
MKTSRTGEKCSRQRAINTFWDGIQDLPREDEEVHPNGIFHFNISRLLVFLDDHPARFPIELIELTEIAKSAQPDQ